MKVILIAAGGTGGHLYPGIALARVLRDKGYKVIFVLKKNDAGIKILNEENLDFIEIPASGMPRIISFKIFRFILNIFRGYFSGRKIIKDIKPYAVFGMGGYISFPMILNAKMCGIKTIIHEQNVIPGISNRLLSKLADKVAVSFEDSKAYFKPKETTLTGNPVRREIFEADYSFSLKKLGLAENKFTVLVFGGSQGAAKINKVIADSWEQLADYRDGIQFLHLSGSRNYEELKNLYQMKNITGIVYPYLNEMGWAYGVADLVIARSGAMTVSELKILNKPAILIPFPFATDNHQAANAMELKKSGKTEVIIEKDLNSQTLAQIIILHVKNYKGHELMPKMPDVLPQEKLAALAEL